MLNTMKPHIMLRAPPPRIHQVTQAGQLGPGLRVYMHAKWVECGSHACKRQTVSGIPGWYMLEVEYGRFALQIDTAIYTL